MAGSLQKLGAHKPLTAHDDSNYARTGGHEVPSGDVGKYGYTVMPYPTAGPATASTDIKNSVDSYASLGNDGTARGSYQIQSEIIGSDNPNTPTGNGGAK